MLYNFFVQMVQIRTVEEFLIQMFKKGEGKFWVGGPGEEAVQVVLGHLINKGYGVNYDFTHLHYRNNGVMLAMGEEPINIIRQMCSTSTDPYTGGRNFVSHPCKKEWNIPPVTSTIQTQFSLAIGTALAQSNNNNGITIVVGGDAGTASPDFESCLIWSKRPSKELPILMVITNNSYGISTKIETQHDRQHIIKRAQALNIETVKIDGTDIIEVWNNLSTAFTHVRETRTPFLIECGVSRLYGHSSSSGASFNFSEKCPIQQLENKLLKLNTINTNTLLELKLSFKSQLQTALKQVKQEPRPSQEKILCNVFK